jgi:hypothetical protein
MKLNENLITISAGYITVDKELNLGDDITLEVEGSVIEKKQSDNQDGTYNVTCKIKGMIAGVKHSGKSIDHDSIQNP